MKLIASCLVFACLASSIYGWSVDFQLKKNADEHKTSSFKDSSKALIVRRLKDFNVIVDVEKGESFTFSAQKVNYLGNKEQLVTLNDEEVNKTVKVEVTKKNKVILQFLAPAEVGKYKLEVILFRKGNRVDSKSTDLYLLFNPWEGSEAVYLAEASEIDEYVLSDSGVMYYGTGYTRDWVFGQYEAGVLDIVFKVLDRATNGTKNNAVTISRAISAIANNYTKGGIIEGRWNSGFAGGTHPLDWTSSVQILKEYNRTNRPVKYGQCYIFAGVVTTILRAMGIPTRTITTDSPAVDKTRDILVNRCIDEDGYSYTEGEFCGADFFWNYHVWNEVWLSREDLRDESPYHSHYGWQALDGTSSVVNEGRYQIGPAPLSAVKLGETNVTYETDVFFADVMAPAVTWLVDSKTGQRKKVISVDYDGTGDRIVTKAIGSDRQLDLYTTYKFRERYWKRVALVNALQNHGTDPSIINHDPKKNASVVFRMQAGTSSHMGEELVVRINLTSVSKTAEKVHLIVIAESVNEHERSWKEIEKKGVNVTLSSGKTQQIVWKFPAEMYADKLYEGNRIAINALGYVEGKDQVWGKREFGTLASARMEVINSVVNEFTGSSTLAFRNPLPIAVTNCYLSLSGLNGIEKTNVGTVPAHGHVKFNIDNSPAKSLIAAILSCDQIKGMTASLLRK